MIRVRWTRLVSLIAWLAVLVGCLVALARPAGPTLTDCVTLIMGSTAALGLLYLAWTER